MPTYQYRCTACQNELEAFQKFTDDPLTTCEECGGSLRKLYNAVGIVFKGSGFYATDSRKSKSSSKPSTESAASKESAPAKESASSSTSTSSKDGAAA